MLIEIEARQLLHNKVAVVFCFFCFMLLSSTLSAATFSLVDKHNSSIDCALKIDGVIQEGDAELYAAAMVELHQSIRGQRSSVSVDYDNNTYGYRICFNSPGGSYIEGIKLARMIDVPTGVDAGDICESACFLAFMSGINTFFMENDGGEVWQDRVMHPLAKVGYHAPALNIAAGNFTAEQVNTAYRIALFSVAELIKLRKERYGSYIFPDYLLEDMLKVPSSEMKYIRTVEQALKAHIVVFPAVLPGAVQSSTFGSEYLQNENYGGFAHACRALGLMSDDFGVGEGPFNSEVVAEEASIKFTAMFDPGESGTSCDLAIMQRFVNDSQWNVGSGKAVDWWIPENVASLAFYMFYPPSTEIDTIDHMLNHDELNWEFVSGFNSKNGVATVLYCAVDNSAAKIVNVQNYTNLRRQAGLNGQVIGQVPLGAQVSVINPGNFLRTDRCAAACNGTNQDAIKQCIDNNDVWIEIQYNGRRGFLSRKFLE